MHKKVGVFFVFYDVYLSLCEKRGIAVSKAAENIGLNRAAVVKWKKGAIPSTTTLQKIADYFNVSTDYLLGTEQKEKPTGNTGEPADYVNGDPVLTAYLEELRTRPEMRMLFSVAKDATKEDVARAVAVIEALRKAEGK